MAHFYSGIQGQAGDATRMGSKSSGISGYVQSWGARLGVDMDHSSMHDIDTGHFRLGPGPSSGSGGTLGMTFRDTNTVVNALGSGDKKIEAIRERIYKEIQRLNEEAPKAVKRAERRRKIEANRREREEKAMLDRELDIIRDMQPEEKARIVRLVDEIELDSDGNFEEMHSLHSLKPRTMGNHTIITVRRCGPLWDIEFDLTDGVWLVPFPPDEMDISREQMHDFGWRLAEGVTA